VSQATRLVGRGILPKKWLVTTNLVSSSPWIFLNRVILDSIYNVLNALATRLELLCPAHLFTYLLKNRSRPIETASHTTGLWRIGSNGVTGGEN
jgi:hypothetical protein